MKTETRALLALSLIPGLGRKRLALALKAAGSGRRLLQLSRADLRHLGFPPAAVESLASGLAVETAGRVEADAERKCATILSPWDREYSGRLKTIFDPPFILYCIGDVTLLNRPSVAIVGSRRCSVYGRQASRKFARDLGTAGVTIVSGLARGVDSMAHQGALESESHTLAVLGNGLDVVYPRENSGLYRAIQERGCLVSEYPFGAHPAARNFPLRNRVISGLCLGTLIVQAAESSGSLITARLALEQNREVWAIPGNIDSPESCGPNYLIRQGAAAVTCSQDVLDDLPPETLIQLSEEMRNTTRGSPGQPEKKLSHREKDVLRVIPLDQALHIDCMVEETKMKLVELNTVLLALELKGDVIRLPGQRFSRVMK